MEGLNGDTIVDLEQVDRRFPRVYVADSRNTNDIKSEKCWYEREMFEKLISVCSDGRPDCCSRGKWMNDI